MNRRLLLMIVPVVLALVGANLAFANSSMGATQTTTRVQAYGTDRWDPITFYAGQLALISVTGDGATDLDLYVYDAAGNLVAKDDDELDFCYVAFTPRVTQPYTIRVVNRGSVYNEYTLRTN